MNRARTTLYIVIGVFIVMFGLPMFWWAFAWILHLATR